MWEKSTCFDQSVQKGLKETPTSPKAFWSPPHSGSAWQKAGETVCVSLCQGAGREADITPWGMTPGRLPAVRTHRERSLSPQDPTSTSVTHLLSDCESFLTENPAWRLQSTDK